VSNRDGDGITITIPWWVVYASAIVSWAPTLFTWVYNIAASVFGAAHINDGSLAVTVLFGIPAMLALPVLIIRKVISSTTGSLKRRFADIDPTIFDGLVPPKLILPPGTRILAALSWLPVRNKSIERVFKPVISDMQLEYIEAIAAERPWLARAICARYYVIIALTVISFAFTASLKRVVEMWKLVG
jgi:hypothetical protein